MSEVPATFILDASLPACAYAVVITVIRMPFVSAQMYQVITVIRMPFVSAQMYPTFTVQPVYSHNQLQYNISFVSVVKSQLKLFYISLNSAVFWHTSLF